MTDLTDRNDPEQLDDVAAYLRRKPRCNSWLCRDVSHLQPPHNQLPPPVTTKPAKPEQWRTDDNWLGIFVLAVVLLAATLILVAYLNNPF